MDKKQLKEVLDYTKKGATLEQIAKHLRISTRTLQRYLKPYRSELNEARRIYKQVVLNIFN